MGKNAISNNKFSIKEGKKQQQLMQLCIMQDEILKTLF